MRAIVCKEFKSPAMLAISTLDDPVPAANEVLIQVKATGLGYVDALTVAGLYQIKPTLPFIPGNEISGVVIQTGAAVKHLRIGQRVLAMPRNGGLAELICLNENSCTPIPEVLSHESAAGFLVNYCTAYHGLTHCGKLQPRELVLILGASGGVGVAAIDIAKALGAEVIAAASSQKKRDACLALGADHVIDYSKEDWRADLQKVLAGRPLNVVYDPVGGDYAEPALRSLGPDGRFLVVGFATGEIPKVPLNLALLKRCAIIGVNWGGFVAANPNEMRPVLTTLLQWIAEGRLHPAAGETMPLQKAGSAMMKMLNRQAIGKMVVTMNDELKT
ncbi:MAG: NADPH:quinone oxidoreductase family protein [Pseudomonadales bacterium]|nr:NADPH:quinone oxidoreductase family protein [Pseudomonadales bacterium]MDP4639254.1 NADPH:quinone oxidoreductase family protein [Pseudomonadales bacterium]MDP4765439.1 NADPH:quinone oxidoreductase family protein [Pseudomonadales bacterium]MDP4876584.1 NADPH:quinone oxidoreductase family protein [Pseudomonadales bacterium]MDP4911512.1 NADPH:quinone oxidoreductase family protein [Pseudomonadales bacterium]